MKKYCSIVAVATAVALSVPAVPSAAISADAPRPNVILILLDDMGYSDIGCFGGEIPTPHIDRLATEGLKFTNFYNAAKCEPTRASLMTGLYWPIARLGAKRGMTLGQAMREAGYTTCAIGKWHLDGNPVDRGFDRYFGHLSGASSFYAPLNASFHLDGEKWQPDDPEFYTTDGFTDFAVEFIETTRKQDEAKPFFIYLAYNAPHNPLQAPEQDIERHRGRYLVGWDKIREQRYARQVELGLVDPETAPLSPRPRNVPAGDSLTAEQKDLEDLRTVPQLTGISDIMPTLLQVAGSHYPAEFRGRGNPPLSGESLVPLFDLSRDRTETKDLAAEPPELRDDRGRGRQFTPPKMPPELRDRRPIPAERLPAIPLRNTKPILAMPVAAPATGIGAVAEPTARPNILVLLTDDQRWDAIGVNNAELAIQTPHIDRLAKRGVNFAEAFVTTPICAVSRASIITGRYSRNARVHDFLIPPPPDVWLTSYPALLKNAGYFLGQLGKYGVGATKEQQTLFDLFDADLTQGEPFHEYEGRLVHDSQWLTLRTQDFLDMVPDGKPFCLQVNYKAPHPSAVVAPEDKDALPDFTFPRSPADTKQQRAGLPQHVRRGLGGFSYPGDFGSDARRNAWVGRYLRKILSVDRSVGAIMAELEQRGLLENTVVIFLSDHGTHFGEQGLTGKWTPYDPSLRIPFIIADPRSPRTAGATSEAIVLNLDVAATILDLAGLPPEPGMDGTSLLPLLEGETPADWRNHFFFEHQMSIATIPRPIPRNMGVRGETEKYVVWTDPVPAIEEFYDLAADPLELNNILGENPAAAAHWRALFQQWDKDHPNTYDFMLYSHRPQTGSPEIDWERFAKAHPGPYQKIAEEIRNRGVSWDDAVHDPDIRWEIGVATRFFY